LRIRAYNGNVRNQRLCTRNHGHASLSWKTWHIRKWLCRQLICRIHLCWHCTWQRICNLLREINMNINFNSLNYHRLRISRIRRCYKRSHSRIVSHWYWYVPSISIRIHGSCIHHLVRLWLTNKLSLIRIIMSLWSIVWLSIHLVPHIRHRLAWSWLRLCSIGLYLIEKVLNSLLCISRVF